MTVTMSSKGQVVIPRAMREQQGFERGTEFTVIAGRGGQLLLVPRRARRGFVAAMARLRGLTLPDLDRPFDLDSLR